MGPHDDLLLFIIALNTNEVFFLIQADHNALFTDSFPYSFIDGPSAVRVGGGKVQHLDKLSALDIRGEYAGRCKAAVVVENEATEVFLDSKMKVFLELGQCAVLNWNGGSPHGLLHFFLFPGHIPGWAALPDRLRKGVFFT